MKDFNPEYAVLYTSHDDQDIYAWFLSEEERERWIVENISKIKHLERIYRPIEKKQRLVSTISSSAYKMAYELKNTYGFKTISETIEYLIKKEYNK
jgi:hypothetical protein